MDFRIRQLNKKIEQLDIARIQQAALLVQDESLHSFVKKLLHTLTPLIQEGQAIKETKKSLEVRSQHLRERLSKVMDFIEESGKKDIFQRALENDLLAWVCNDPIKGFLHAIRQRFVTDYRIFKPAMCEFVQMFKVTDAPKILDFLEERKVLDKRFYAYCPMCDGPIIFAKDEDDENCCMTCGRIFSEDEITKELQWLKGEKIERIMEFEAEISNLT